MSSPRPRQTPSRDAILRAVASSTAIETGQPVADIEARLRNGKAGASLIPLALKRPVRTAQR